ncbi:hypothetical protein Bca52824_046775 [Brassica carinata]|uniref:Uncharacterized protein n=1 Tax=Brassica carinata TaxID=52824 RepID=A0A8X7RF44_BRACI|nr:hypothetical protein Bca52824_046775 [Brassica carinata]
MELEKPKAEQNKEGMCYINSRKAMDPISSAPYPYSSSILVSITSSREQSSLYDLLEESKKNTVVVSTNYTSPVPGRATASASSSSCSQSENSCCGTSSSNKGDEEDVNVDLTEQKKANDVDSI